MRINNRLRWSCFKGYQQKQILLCVGAIRLTLFLVTFDLAFYSHLLPTLAQMHVIFGCLQQGLWFVSLNFCSAAACMGFAAFLITAVGGGEPQNNTKVSNPGQARKRTELQRKQSRKRNLPSAEKIQRAQAGPTPSQCLGYSIFAILDCTSLHP